MCGEVIVGKWEVISLLSHFVSEGMPRSEMELNGGMRLCCNGR